MVHLDRSGRRFEALEVYQQLRTTLVEELGLEPSGKVRQLHCRLLATQGLEMEGTGDAAAMAAAQAAVVEARALGDPSALGYALDGLARLLGFGA